MVYINITGADLRPPALDMDRPKYLAVVSFRCELEDKPEKSEIYCLKTNLIQRNELNPDQILCFITAKKNQTFITFAPNHIITKKMATRRLGSGRFYLTNLRDDDIKIVDAALQLMIRDTTRPQV